MDGGTPLLERSPAELPRPRRTRGGEGADAAPEAEGGPHAPRSRRLLLGDNLTWLRRLKEDPAVRERVRLVYIDPPFSTGRAFALGRSSDVAYEDRRQGEEFLSFLRERLHLLRDLLAPDGSIYLHIDTKVSHRVRLVMDQVFGPERCVNEITRVKCNPKNFSRAAYGNCKDTVLFYSKGRRYVWNEARAPLEAEEVRKRFPKVDADGRAYTTTPLHAPGVTRDGPTGRPWKELPPPSGRHWRYPPEELSRLDRQGRVEWSATGNPRLKIYADQVAARGKKLQDLWVFKDPPYPRYPTEKNLQMLRVLVGASSRPGDLVLDAFCGSGTTLVAAEEMHRGWIGIDDSPAAVRVAEERLRQAGAVVRPETLTASG